MEWPGLKPESVSWTEIKYDLARQNLIFSQCLKPGSAAHIWHQQYSRANPFPAGWQAVRDTVPFKWTVAVPNEAAFLARFRTLTQESKIIDRLGRLYQGGKTFKELVDEYDVLAQQLPAASMRGDAIQRDDLKSKMTPKLCAALNIAHPNVAVMTKDQFMRAAINVDENLPEERGPQVGR